MGYKEIHYDYWKMMDEWQLYQAVCLICEIEPSYVDSFVQRTYVYPDPSLFSLEHYVKVLPPQEQDRVLKIIKLVRASIDSGKLVCKGRERVTPSEFIKWALSKKLDVPDALRELANGLGPGEEIPPYLNSMHPYYSKELAAAVRAWMYIYGDNNLDLHNPSHKPQIEKWLRKTYEKDENILKVKTIERITTMVNVYKKRGSGSKSSSKIIPK